MIALDVRLFHGIQDTFSHGGWLLLMCVLTVVGSGWGSLVVVPLFASPRTRRFAQSLTATLVVSAILVFTLKAIVQRKRPYLALPGVQSLAFETPTDFSFPSGHAAGSFTFAMFVSVVLIGHVLRRPAQRKRRIAFAVFMMLCALGIGLSRITLGVHYPGDVLAGALLGSSVGFLGARIHQRRIARLENRPSTSNIPGV